MNMRFGKFSPSLCFAGMATVLGVALVYRIANADDGFWSQPYVETYSSADPLVFIQNSGDGPTADGIDGWTFSADPASVGVYGHGNLGLGVYGYSVGDIGTAGVYGWGHNNGTNGNYGVYGTSDLSYGVLGNADGANADGAATAAGVYGTGSSQTAIGVLGSANGSNPAMLGMNVGTGNGVNGQSTNKIGVYGTTSGTDPVNAIQAAGVWGQSATAIGVMGQSSSGEAGVFGMNNSTGPAVIGIGNSGVSPTGYFFNNSTDSNGVGAQGQCNAGIGVRGYGTIGVNGVTDVSGGNAGYFQGNVQVTGTISGAAKYFKIDHPLDPANKYLMHSCIESSEMINLYRGNVTLDSNGSGTVEMPDWFQAENREFSYQLTAVGAAAPNLHIAREIEHNRFEIAGGKQGMKVSWQVTGARQDPYAKAHPIEVEQEKAEPDKGKYLDPADYGKPNSAGIGPMPVQMPAMRTLPPMSAAAIKPLSDKQISLPMIRKVKMVARKPRPFPNTSKIKAQQ